MLRDWTDSEKVNSLSVHSERFFTRLIMKVDDHGCFYADTRLLKANLFPLLLDNIREADLLRWMAECQKAGLIVLYENTNKKYVQILDFRQRLDKAKSKYPQPSVNDFPETVNDYRAELETELEPEKKPKGAVDKNFIKNNQEEIQDAAPEIIFPFVSDEFMEMWGHWKKYKKTEYKFLYKSLESEQAALSELANLSKGFEETAIAIIRQSMAKGWKGFFELKNIENGSGNSANGKQNSKVTGDELNQAHAKYFGK